MSQPSVTDFDEHTEPERGAILDLARRRGISVAAARRLYGLPPEPPRPPHPARSRAFLLIDTGTPFRYEGWYWLKASARTALRLDPTPHGNPTLRIHLRERTFDFDTPVEPVPLAALPAALQTLVRRQRARGPR
ncbi:MAG: hypothetical protein D6685_12250 [Bacteroidetes bacterium]|nr:MAG: hypothetical protein D6685_12250 [Bacteroidota bacterium]